VENMKSRVDNKNLVKSLYWRGFLWTDHFSNVFY